MTEEIKISIVSPVYKAENLLDELVKRIVDSVGNITDNYEIILVEDGSPDESWAKIENNCQKHHRIIGLKLSRNFGQHYAITSGLKEASGDWIVVLDCDLQDQPEEIEKLFNKTKEGFDAVLARREIRQDGFFKKISSKLFYRVFGYLTDTKQDSSIANFGIYHRKVIKSILSMGDYYRYFPAMVQWVGYKRCEIDVDHAPRSNGKSTYTIRKLFKLAFNNIIAFSDKPLLLSVRVGLFVMIAAILFGAYTLYKYAVGAITEIGYASLILSVWFLFGVTLLMLGVVGIYIGKLFETAKERPCYIVEKKISHD